MQWDVILHEGFHRWYVTLPVGLQEEILAYVELLRRLGPNLARPRADTVKGSLYSNMKELRIQFKGDPWRIFFAFDPRRRAILLVGGNKRGKQDWYRQHIRIADERFREHLRELEEEEET